MLLMARSAEAAWAAGFSEAVFMFPMPSRSPRRDGDGALDRRVGSCLTGDFLAAIARRDVLLLRVRRRRLLDHRAHQILVGLDPVGDHLPLLAVPLLELHRTAAFVVGAGHLERLHEA